MAIFVYVSLLALSVRVLSLIALHLLPTGRDPIRDAVSSYAISRYGALDGVQKFTGGLCTVSLAIALIAGHAPVSAFGLVMLVINGIALLLIVTVPTQATDTKESFSFSLRWLIHTLLALISFSAIALVTGTLTWPILMLPTWHGPGILLLIAGIWTPVSVIIFFIVMAGGIAQWRPYFGLIQRSIYLGTICWLGAVLIPMALTLK